MTKEQLIDIFARFILENSNKDKYFYPKNEVQCNGNTEGFGPSIPGSNPGTSTK